VRLGRAAAEAAALGLGVTRRAERQLSRFERGEIELKVHHQGLDRVTREFESMTNRLALALVLAASVVALAVALGVHGLSGIEPYVRVLFGLGFVFSLGFGVWLLVSILRSGRR
jgi:ubiquinone biosynthesis protein